MKLWTFKNNGNRVELITPNGDVVALFYPPKQRAINLSKFITGILNSEDHVEERQNGKAITLLAEAYDRMMRSDPPAYGATWKLCAKIKRFQKSL